MNGSLEANRVLIDGIRAADISASVEILVCPPFPYLASVAEALGSSQVAIGAQTVSEFSQGAYTGEVEAGMLCDLGVTYALLGHSERRSIYGESDEAVAAKFKTAVAAGLKPILCVGETLEEREAGQTEAVVSRQIQVVVEHCGINAFKEAVIAYEPVWAIGTGRTASPEMAEAVHTSIRSLIASHDDSLAAGMRILYGGSMKAANAADLLSQENIDGGLIGGASLVADDFMAIASAAAGLSG